VLDVSIVSVNEGRWEAVATAYRVYFWSKMSDPEPPELPLWRCEARRLAGAADVAEVLAWAKEDADARRFTVYAEVDGPPEGLVQVFGVDPTVAK
jgi:hypothetical protein